MLKYLLILGLALGAPPARSNNTPKRRTVTNDDGTTTEVAHYNNKTVRAGIGGFCEYDVNHVYCCTGDINEYMGWTNENSWYEDEVEGDVYDFDCPYDEWDGDGLDELAKFGRNVLIIIIITPIVVICICVICCCYCAKGCCGKQQQQQVVVVGGQQAPVQQPPPQQPGQGIVINNSYR